MNCNNLLVSEFSSCFAKWLSFTASRSFRQFNILKAVDFVNYFLKHCIKEHQRRDCRISEDAFKTKSSLFKNRLNFAIRWRRNLANSSTWTGLCIKNKNEKTELFAWCLQRRIPSYPCFIPLYDLDKLFKVAQQKLSEKCPSIKRHKDYCPITAEDNISPGLNWDVWIELNLLDSELIECCGERADLISDRWMRMLK